MAEPLETLAGWLKDSASTVVLTGAGMSTESGIPDFRSKDGWWRGIDPMSVATVEALEGDYELFREFYSTRISGLRGCQPHRGHYLLAEWEARGLVQLVATQNVDGFHQKAGSRRVEELHGSIRTARCRRCDRTGTLSDFLAGTPCTNCGGKLRPNIVLFGEMLPQDVWNASMKAIQRADLVLVIGTSLQVYPVNQLPTMTHGRVAILNKEATEMDVHFDLVVHGKAGETLEAINNLL